MIIVIKIECNVCGITKKQFLDVMLFRYQHYHEHQLWLLNVSKEQHSNQEDSNRQTAVPVRVAWET